MANQTDPIVAGENVKNVIAPILLTLRCVRKCFTMDRVN